MTQAARLADPIGHSPTMNWLVRGAIIGAAIGLGAVAIVGTGGLAAVAVVGGLVAGGAGIGEMLSTMSFAAKEVSGAIIGPGSLNVFTNGRPAARAHLDMTLCAKHAPAPLPIATGSATVFINGQPAARVDDTIACSAVITSGSGTVFIGGAKQQTDQISPEDLVPPLVHAAILVVGLGAAVVLAGPVVAVAGLVLGTAGGIGGNWAGGKIFGEGSDGQKWSALGGGLVGGWLGAKGGSILAGKLIPTPATPVQGFIKSGLSQPSANGATSADLIAQRVTENANLRDSPQFTLDKAKVGITDEQIARMWAKEAPLGFESREQFTQFKSELDISLKNEGLLDAEIGMKGTSTTFYSENPGKPLGHHWDADPVNPGDYDLNITSKTMVDRLQLKNIAPSEKYGVFKTSDMENNFPHLDEFQESWSKQLGREVNFVGYPKPVGRDVTEYVLRSGN